MLKILACPKCKSPLGLGLGNEIRSRIYNGKLHCPKHDGVAEIVDEVVYFRKIGENIVKLPIPLDKEVKRKWLKFFSKQELAALRREWKWMFGKLNLKRSKTHLDWATGTGRFLREVSEVFRENIIVLEYDRATCIWLKDFLKKIGKYSKVSIVCCDARNMPLRSNSIDSVSSWHGLDEPNIKKALNESRRVLKGRRPIACSGFFLKETLKSLNIAAKEKMEFVIEGKSYQYFRRLGFTDVDYKIFWEGKWTSRRDFLPKFGDHCVNYGISGRKPL